MEIGEISYGNAEAPALPKEAERIEDLEFLPPKDRAVLYLVAHRQKPACYLYITVQTDPDDEAIDKNLRDNADRLTAVLSESGVLFAAKEITDPDDPDIRHRDFYIGQDEASLTALQEAAFRGKGHAAAFGRALGYPETAIAAYGNGRHARPRANIPPDVRASAAYQFCPFVPSPDYWREELATVAKQAEFVRENNPQLYEQVMASRLK
jgi:hypothetical protein